jgi:hypothetical protein
MTVIRDRDTRALITGWCTGVLPGSQAPLPVLDGVDAEVLAVDVLTVAGPVVGVLELVVPGEVVDVVGGVPLPVVGVVVLD